MNSDRVYYVGGTGNLLRRLEDHREGKVRQTVLTTVCTIEGLQTVWPHDDPQHVYDILEPRLGRWLQEANPRAYVHYR